MGNVYIFNHFPQTAVYKEHKLIASRSDADYSQHAEIFHAHARPWYPSINYLQKKLPHRALFSLFVALVWFWL